MAGKNQHFIPRLLQRGFLCRKTKKRDFTFAYCKEYEPRERRIDSLGAQTHFYSGPSSDGSPTLDDKITAYENNLGVRLNEWRELDPGTPIDSALASEVVTHLSSRTQSLRTTFWSGVTTLMNSMRDKLSDRDGIADIFGLEDNSADSVLASSIRQAVRNRPEFKLLCSALDIPASVFEKLMLFLFREHFASFSGLLSRYVNTELLPVLKLTPDTVHQSHNEALSTLMDEGDKRSDFREMLWSIEGPAHGEFILPDCVSVSIGSSGQFAPFIVSEDKVRDFVLLPISHDRMLVGRRLKDFSPDLSVFNREAAACSASFFVAKTLNDELSGFRNLIGSRSESFMRKMSVDALIAKPEPIVEDTKSSTTHQPIEQFQLTLFDWGDQSSAEKLRDIIQPIVAKFGSMLNLSRLEGITVAYDYPRAVRDLDRGDPNLQPSSTVAEDVGIGMAQSPLIFREGLVRFRTILRYDIAHALMGEDEAATSYALHLLANQFAYIDVVTAIDQQLPGNLLRPIDDYLTGVFFQKTYPAITDYLTARSSFGFGIDETIKTDHVSSVKAALELYAEELSARIATYQEHRDVDRLLSEALEIVGHFLSALARFIGYLDGINEDFSEVSEIQSKLRQEGLDEWAQRFAMELRRLWKGFGKWAFFEEFTDLNVHVERLMWRHGLFIWPEGNGGHVRVMPPAFDFNSLVKNIPEQFTRNTADPKHIKTLDEVRKSQGT